MNEGLKKIHASRKAKTAAKSECVERQKISARESTAILFKLGILGGVAVNGLGNVIMHPSALKQILCLIDVDRILRARGEFPGEEA